MARAGAVSHQSLAVGPTSLNNKSFFISPALSLALQTGIMEGQEGEIITRVLTDNQRNNGNYNNGDGGIKGQGRIRRSREEDQEEISKSGGSDYNNLDGASASGDDHQQPPDDVLHHLPPRKKRYHRHTPNQIQQLETVFKECPHPDEKQRLELSKRLCLGTTQVKFWFQNRRTQLKTQLERHENSILKQEIDRLRVENMSIREAMRNPTCIHCGGPAIIGDISMEEHHLRIENARLKDELDRVCSLASKFLRRPISTLSASIAAPPQAPSSALELGVGTNGLFGPLTNSTGTMMINLPTANVAGIDHRSFERSMYLELAMAAMDELVKMAQTDEPLWLRSMKGGGREVLNHEEYMRSFNPCIGLKPNSFVTEATRETGMVAIHSLALVETLMDSNRWAEMFPCIIARASTIDVISSGMGGTKNGALELMRAELQVVSPLVPVRTVNFLRFSKQHAEGVWAVVDVSIDSVVKESCSAASPTYINCRRLPSGCVVRDMLTGYSKITWIEHTEYNESGIHPLYRSFISAGMGFGARRWITTLQRQCECLPILMSPTVPSGDRNAITWSGQRSMLKLGQRMMSNFCAGVCASTVHKWNKLDTGNVDEDVRVMTRKSMDDPGEPSGIVLSAATSVWLPVSPENLFDFLHDERLRCEWDILSNGGPMQEMARIAKGQHPGNSISVLRTSVTAMNTNQSSMLILQDTYTDASGSLVVYAPVDIPAMHVVMNGGDTDYVALLPSGFAIIPGGTPTAGHHQKLQRAGGSLLTVAFQILVNSIPSAKLTIESVETVNNLISCTLQKIRTALHCNT